MAGHRKVCSCFWRGRGLAAPFCLLLSVIPCQGQSSPRSFNSSDVNPQGVCKQQVQKHCRDVLLGDARMANCLRKNLMAHGGMLFSGAIGAQKDDTKCFMEVTQFFIGVSKKKVPAGDSQSFIPVDIVPGFRKACLSDAVQFCKEKKDQSSVPCLKAHRRELKRPCKQALLRIKMQEATNMELDKPFSDACKADIDAMPECRDIPLASNLGQKKACLKKHRGSLSSKCREHLFQKEKEDAEDLRLNVDIHERCHWEEKTFCKDTTFGEARMIKCLWDSKNKMDFGTTCRSKVEILMQRTMQNYQLDYRFKKQCASEIETLCADEKARLDAASEADREALAGTVFNCLKTKYVEVKRKDCQVELNRVVRVHAESAKTDPIFHAKCFADVSAFCETAEKHKLHICLRQHLEELGEECKEYELLQGSVEARDISMKPSLKKACTEAIRIFCSDVPHGDAQIIRCLQNHRHDSFSSFPTHCAEAVQEDLEASNHDLRLKYGISGHCRKDAETLCSEQVIETGGVGLIACLKRKYSKVDDSGCRQELRRFFASGAENIKAAPDTYEACVDDVNTICPNVSPGQGRIHQCLLKNKEQLSEMCLISEFEQQALQVMDISLSPTTMKVCKTQMTKFCPQGRKTDGSMWKCLEDHKSQMGVNNKCRTVVLAHELRTNSEYHLNPKLVENCRRDVKVLCKEELDWADSKDFSSDGRVIGCLIEKRAKISAEICKEGILLKQRQRLESIENDPEARRACHNDIAKYCSDGHGQTIHSEKLVAVSAQLEVGAMHKCLQGHLKNLTQSCKKKEQMYAEMKYENIKLAPHLRKICLADTIRFCKSVDAGDSRVVDCLMDHMHNQDMSRHCQNELLKIQEKRATNRAVSSGLTRMCADDFKLLAEAGKCKSFTASKEALTKIKSPAAMMAAIVGANIGKGPIECLLDHKRSVKSFFCKQEIEAEQRRESNDLRAKPGMWEACKDDVHKLCPRISFGSGRLHRCLRKASKKISSEKCLEMVIAVKKVEGEDVTINPVFRKDCANEVSSFCKGVPHGNQRIAKCLSLHKNDTGFSESCHRAFMETASKEVLQSLKEMDFKAKFMSPRETLNWLKENGHLKSSGGMIAGMVIGAIFALSIVGLCLWVVTKKLKGGYSVMVPRNLQA